jgi:ATP-dependent DNA helicase RecG
MRELGEGMRRIFELMKSNDLTPPDLVADNNIFSVTLHHKFIYTREQKLWLDAFETFNLSREQKTILLLGYNNHIISPKEIWDAVGIVDTEYYRQLIASLSELGIIERVTSKAAASNLAKKKKIPVKHVPRFAIRIPGANLAVTSPQASSAIIEDGTQKRTVESEAVDDKSEYARVYVSNLPYDINESALSEALSQYGAIADVAIPHDRVSHRNKGYGFVEFDDASDAAKAISDSSNVNLGGRRLSVRQAEPRSKPPIPRAASERRMEATLSTEPIKPRRPRRPR